MQPIPISPPNAGIDEKTPTIALSEPFCENLYNFNCTRAGVALRNGDSKYKLIENTTGLTSQAPVRFFQYGDQKLFALILDDTADTLVVVDTNDGSVVHSVAGALGTDYEYFQVFFNGYLFFYQFSPAGATLSFTYDPFGVFAPVGYTIVPYPSYTFNPVGGDVYRSRQYIIQFETAVYWYSNINAVSGALTLVDLSGIISTRAYLTIIGTFSLANQLGTELYQAFVFSTGEVLFYQGTYPDASDWRMAGRAAIGSPLDYGSSITYQGDTLVFCDSGVVSLRDLFLQGSVAAQALTVNTRIQKTWVELVKLIRLATGVSVGPIRMQGLRGVYDSINNRIIICFPYYLDGDEGLAGLETGAFYFIYDTIEQAWFYHRSFGYEANQGIKDMAVYKNKVLTMCSASTSKTMIFEKEGGTGFTDRSSDDDSDNGVEYEIVSAPIRTGRAYASKAAGMDVIINSDLYDETEYQLIRDLGVAETAAQLVSGSGIAGALAKPFVNIGIEGTSIQYKISGTTVAGKTVGYQFYGGNFWLDQGTSPR